MRKLKVAIIGAGRMGRFHLETLKDMKNIELVAILTTANGTENRKKLKNKYKIKNDYENIDELLSHSNIDVAFIQQSVQEVYPIEKKLLSNKINCLIEKPPALDIKKVLELERLTKKNNLVSVVGFQRRFYSNLQVIKKYYKQLGYLYSINVEAPESFDVIKNKKKFIKPVLKKWFYSNGIHMIDLMLFFANSEIKQIYKITRKIEEKICNNSFNAIIKFKKNLVGQYISNWKSPGSWSIKLYYTNGQVVISPIEKTKIIFPKNKVIEIKNSKIDEKYKPGLFLQNKHFLEACYKNKKLNVNAGTLRDAYNAMKLIDFFEK